MKNIEAWYWSKTESCTYASYRIRVYDVDAKCVIHDTGTHVLTSDVAVDNWRYREREAEALVGRHNVAKVYETAPGMGVEPEWSRP